MKKYFLLCASITLASCVTDSSKSTEVIESTIHGRIMQSCPIGVICDEKFDYHAYSGEIDSINFYISFDPSIVKDKSKENILSSFSYLNLTFSFPSLKTDSSTFYVTSPPLRKNISNSGNFTNQVLNFENGKLFGKISFFVDNITERIESRSESCSSGDILGMCYRNVKLEKKVNYVINYELLLVE